MREFTGPNAEKLKIASLVMQQRFVDQFKKLDHTQLKSAIDSFLGQDLSIPLILRFWLKCLRMPFVPLGFSKMMILSTLRAQSSKLMWSQKGKVRKKLMHYGRKIMYRTKIG